MSARSSAPDYAPALDHREAGRHDEAIAGLKTWLAAHHDDAVAYAHLSQLFSLTQQHDEAWLALNRTQEIDPVSPIVQRSRARLLLKKGEFELAVERASAACEMSSDDKDSQLALAASLTAAGKLDKALSVEASRRNGGRSTTHFRCLGT